MFFRQFFEIPNTFFFREVTVFRTLFLWLKSVDFFTRCLGTVRIHVNLLIFRLFALLTFVRFTESNVLVPKVSPITRVCGNIFDKTASCTRKRNNIIVCYVTVNFDELGLTDNENPFGAFQPLFARSLGSTMGSILTGYVADFMGNRRSIRSTRSIPDLPKPIHSYFKGGER